MVHDEVAPVPRTVGKQARDFNVAASSVIDVETELTPSVAVRVSNCWVVTASAVMTNEAVLAPEITVTGVGTVSKALLDRTVIPTPPAGAGFEMVTVHVELPPATRVDEVQLKPLTPVWSRRIRVVVREFPP